MGFTIQDVLAVRERSIRELNQAARRRLPGMQRDLTLEEERYVAMTVAGVEHVFSLAGIPMPDAIAAQMPKPYVLTQESVEGYDVVAGK